MVQNTMLSPQAGTNLRLYTIGIGDNFFGEQNILRSAASAGRGLYVRATDFASLERNINKVFLDIISNATSFSVAAITTVQTRGTTFAFIPRFRPLGGSQWEGRLYRFRLFNEFAAGCSTTDLTSGPDGGPARTTANPNGYASCSDQDCGTDLMRFVEGRDVLRQNIDGGLTRPNILGDIFHSSPILVTPPVPTFLCDTGIMNQCVRTLYAQDVSGQYTPNSQSAYTDYYNNKLARQELILVGANDGMLHAFHAGNYQDGGTFDEGTGLEVWAFVPPDMVPKLQRYALSANHSILLDGSPWVRDIWKDGSGSSSADRQKQSDEFHTVAIVGEREGGRHYTAIDLTDTTSNPKYLWTWPPPGSNYDLAVGESWNDTTPNPPPVGPILIQDNSGPVTITVNNSPVKASERWVVAVAGGFDPNLIRGRSVYVLDAWDGTLLYKFSRYDTSSSSDPRYNLGSVLSPISMIDSNYDNFF